MKTRSTLPRDPRAGLADADPRGRAGRGRQPARDQRHHHQDRQHRPVHGRRLELQRLELRADGVLPLREQPGRRSRPEVRDRDRRRRLQGDDRHRGGQEAHLPGQGVHAPGAPLQRGGDGGQADDRRGRAALDRGLGQPEADDADRHQHVPRHLHRHLLGPGHGPVRAVQAQRQEGRPGRPHQRLGQGLLRPRHGVHEGAGRRAPDEPGARAGLDRRHRPVAPDQDRQRRLRPRLPLRGGAGDPPAGPPQVRGSRCRSSARSGPTSRAPTSG